MSGSDSPGWALFLDGGDMRIETIEELRSALQSISQNEYSDVILVSPDGDGVGPALYMLRNRDRAWLMYLRFDGDAGFSSRNPAYQGPSDATLDFYLSNGQLDHYPVAWVIPLAQARAAFESFFEHGKKPSSINWHDDSG